MRYAAPQAVITARRRAIYVLGTCGYARDALVGRMMTADNLGFGPHR